MGMNMIEVLIHMYEKRIIKPFKRRSREIIKIDRGGELFAYVEISQ
jgi:hypothetical protein